MKKIYYKSDTRGHANFGWLDTYHSFSFGRYYNPDRMNFGALRVLNDDTIDEGMGFDTHPHDNMEIITIPLKGDLAHKDSMGNSSIIKEGDIQVMSAGKGIQHSEFNPNENKNAQILQIWIIPREKDVEPRYDQISIKNLAIKDDFFLILSPYKDKQGVWIHQDAWFYMGDFSEGFEQKYNINKTGNGAYIFVIEGETEIEGQTLLRRDALGIYDINSINIKANKKSKFLIIEVPMKY